jgi:hypothetical protein
VPGCAARLKRISLRFIDHADLFSECSACEKDKGQDEG